LASDFLRQMRLFNFTGLLAVSQGIYRVQQAQKAPQGVPPYCALSSMEFS
jgi:hypothetical protein